MVRLSGLKDITQTFPTKTKAKQFVREVEGDAKIQQLLGNPITNQLTISSIVNEYMDQYSGKDISIVGKLQTIRLGQTLFTGNNGFNLRVSFNIWNKKFLVFGYNFWVHHTNVCTIDMIRYTLGVILR